MTVSKRAPLQTTEIDGVPLDYMTLGEGRSLLFLHGIEELDATTNLHLHELARHFRVVAPWHPGFSRRNRPEGLRDVADLAYLYLDLADAFEMRDAVLVGASFGGWIAAEMLVRNASAFSHLILSSPLGIKVRSREDRDVADFFAMTEEEFRDIAYANPRKGVKISPASTTTTSLSISEVARRSPSMAGSRTCTIPSSVVGYIALRSRP